MLITVTAVVQAFILFGWLRSHSTRDWIVIQSVDEAQTLRKFTYDSNMGQVRFSYGYAERLARPTTNVSGPRGVSYVSEKPSLDNMGLGQLAPFASFAGVRVYSFDGSPYPHSAWAIAIDYLTLATFALLLGCAYWYVRHMRRRRSVL